MPRRPTGAVRAQHPPLPRRGDAIHDAQGVSPTTLAAIRKLELARDDLWRGAVRTWLWAWRIEACGAPCRAHEYDGQCRDQWDYYDDGHWDREQLEDVLRLLPGHAARDLRRVIARFDNHHLSGCPGWRVCRWNRIGRTSPTWLQNRKDHAA